METDGVTIKHYGAVHYWLRYKFGVATKCENKQCEGKSKYFQWAKKRNKQYEFKRANFQQLCASCHRKYDCTEETRRKVRDNTNHRKTHCKRGHEFNDMNTYRWGKNGIWRMCIICDRANYVKWTAEHPTFKRARVRKQSTK